MEQFIIHIMARNNTSQQLSYLDDSRDGPLVPINLDNNFHKNPVFFTNKSTNNKATNRVINILAPGKPPNKLQFNQEFIDEISKDQKNENMLIVSFVGSKSVGKSFLVDLLISRQQKSSSRLLSKNPKPFINAPTFEFKAKNGENIHFFDTNGEGSNESFLWLYFVSSIIVLNISQDDRKGQQDFLNKLSYLRNNLQNNADELGSPQLIILRRDSKDKEFKQKEFLQKIQNSHLFNNDIATINMAYPGNNNVLPKDIVDVSQNLLNENFINDVQNLSWMIKSGRSKEIKGNSFNSKIAGLSLHPLTQSINKNGKVNTNKIWQDVIETLSIGYYNFYLKNYADELQVEFKDEQPCDKYTLYKRLSKVKRNVDKKVQGFNKISGDPIYEKYREKIQQKIKKKEEIIKQINKKKSITKNDEYCKKLFSEMNDDNCEELIKKYCESKLDDNKSEVLLNNFEVIMKKRLTDIDKSQHPALKPSTEIQQLERQLRQIQQKIAKQKSNKVDVRLYGFDKIQQNIDGKQKELKDLQKELLKQKDLSNEKKINQNKDITELQKKIQNLKKITKDQERQIQNLRISKEKEAKVSVEQLNRKLIEEEQKYKKLQQQVKRSQEQAKDMAVSAIKTGKPSTKDTCCQIM